MLHFEDKKQQIDKQLHDKEYPSLVKGLGAILGWGKSSEMTDAPQMSLKWVEMSATSMTNSKDVYTAQVRQAILNAINNNTISGITITSTDAVNMPRTYIQNF